MATQEKITLVCDRCGATDTTKTRTLRRDRRKPRFVEACDPCWQPVLDLESVGRLNPTPPIVD